MTTGKAMTTGKKAWAVWIPGRYANRVASLRLEPGVVACWDEQSIWLYGEDWGLELAGKIRQVPDAVFHWVDEAGRTCEQGRRLARGRLPEGDWRPLAEWIRPALPRPITWTARLARTPLRLVRSNLPKDEVAVLTECRHWVRYATELPNIRLRRWRFAVSREGRVFVYGTPPPAMPGQRYYEESRVLLPCGWRLSRGISGAVVRSLLEADDDAWLLASPSQDWERISATDLVHATRSAIRVTQQQLGTEAD